MYRRYMTGKYVRIEDSIENRLHIRFLRIYWSSPIKLQTWVYDVSMHMRASSKESKLLLQEPAKCKSQLCGTISDQAPSPSISQKSPEVVRGRCACMYRTAQRFLFFGQHPTPDPVNQIENSRRDEKVAEIS